MKAKACSCGGECYKIFKLYNTKEEKIRVSICKFITHCKKSEQWDLIHKIGMHDPLIDKHIIIKSIPS